MAKGFPYETLVGSYVGPMAMNVYAIHSLMSIEAEIVAWIQSTRRMIGKTGNHLNVMPLVYPTTGQLINASRRCANFRSEIMCIPRNIQW